MKRAPGPQDRAEPAAPAERPSSSPADLHAAAFRAAPYALAVFRASDTRILEVNDEWERLFGYRREEAVGRSPLELLLYASAPERDRLLATFAAEGYVRDFEIALRTRSGDVLQTLVSSEPIGVAGERCFITTVRDVTERRRTELALRETEERNRAILQVIPDLMFLQSLDGVYLDFHARDRGLLYSSPEWFVGRNMREVLPERVAEGFLRRFAETTETGEPSVYEYSLPMSGEERYYEARVMACGGDRVLSIVRDITERKRAEEEIRASNERVKELAGRLVAAQEEERRRISRELHDDLNQRIAALTIAISTLRRRLPDSRDELLDRLGELQASAVELADDVRMLSHRLHSAVLEHAGLAAALEAFCEEFGARTGVEVSLAVSGDAALLPRDVALCVYRVAQEALRNVARHAGTARATVRLECTGRDVLIVVSDDGVGFAWEEAKLRGGLGIVSMRERVRLLRGTLVVESCPGDGAVVRARVPYGEQGSGIRGQGSGSDS